MSFREWLEMKHAQELERGHRRRARAFREALALLDSGNIARAASAVPTHDRAAARALAADAIARRASTQRRRRRAA